MVGIFINYRVEDSQTAAALIDRELTTRFGKDQVFLDSRSILAGMDFANELLERLRSCSVLLVVIGPNWLTITSKSGKRRIDDPSDWIHREIVEALTHGLRIIPVLIDAGTLPAESDLPGDIAGLSRRQYVQLRSRYASLDLAHLVERLVEADPELAKADKHHKPSPRLVPRQLPVAPRRFVGRGAELAILTAATNNAGGSAPTLVISAIGGTGGTGKTWLALQWAYQHLEHFPDGQLFVNLRGFDPHGEPMSAATAVRGFLNALGVEPAEIPATLDAQVGLYRSLVAGQRLLVVLDNARDSEQIEPLLPSSSTCTVLITSRRRLVGVVTKHGADPLHLDVLSETEAWELLAHYAGADRLAAEPNAVAELLSFCAGLPLALTMVGARAAAHPGFPLSVLADELRDHTTRLDSFDDGEMGFNLRAVFSWSYQALTDDAAVLFCLLGLVPGPDISVPAIVSLIKQPLPRVQVLLRELETAHLATQPAYGRYRMHDLLRLYATDQAHHNLSGNRRNAALRRLVDFYLHSAHHANRLIDPLRLTAEPGPLAPGCQPYFPPDYAAAMAWLNSEHPCLLATQYLASDMGWYAAVWQLPWVLHAFHYRRGHLPDLLATWQAGLAAADRCGERAVVIRAHRGVGWAYSLLDQHIEAIDHLGHALGLAEDADDLTARAHTHQALAWAWRDHGDDQQALEHATKALRLYQALNRPVSEADMLVGVGWLATRLGYHDQARTHYQAALDLCRQQNHRDGEATTLKGLGYLAQITGQLNQAADHYERALNLYCDLGYTYLEAETLEHLGDTHAALNHHDRAWHVWKQALHLYETQRRTVDMDRIRRQLDMILDATVGEVKQSQRQADTLSGLSSDG